VALLSCLRFLSPCFVLQLRTGESTVAGFGVCVRFSLFVGRGVLFFSHVSSLVVVLFL
jgi:hypothetical protein